MHWLDNLPPLTPEAREAMESFRPGPVFDLLGMCVDRVEAGHSWLSLPFKVELTHGGGIVQGGIITALADAAIAFAVRSVIDGSQQDQTSIDLKMNFIRPVAKGAMRAEGWLIHQGRRTVVGEAMVFNEQGKPVAKCLSSVMLLDAGYMPSHPHEQSGK